MKKHRVSRIHKNALANLSGIPQIIPATYHLKKIRLFLFADATNVYNTVDEKWISSGVFYLLAVGLVFPTKQKGSSARKSPFTAYARTRHPPPQRPR
jgi:hypothetical protein